MRYTVYPCLVSCPFYAIPIYVPFLIYEIFLYKCTCLLSFFLLLLAVTVIECNNNFLSIDNNIKIHVSLEAVMHAIMIPYDMIHNYMYAQELVRAKGLKEWQFKHDYLFYCY